MHNNYSLIYKKHFETVAWKTPRLKRYQVVGFILLVVLALLSPLAALGTGLQVALSGILHSINKGYQLNSCLTTKCVVMIIADTIKQK